MKLKIESDFKYGPTAIFVLDSGSLAICEKSTPSKYTLFPSSESIWSIQETNNMGDNLMLLYLIIISGLFSFNPFEYQPDMISYAHNSGFITPTKHFKKEDLENSIIDFDGKKLDMGKMYKLQERYKALKSSNNIEFWKL